MQNVGDHYSLLWCDTVCRRLTLTLCKPASLGVQAEVRA
jgi:hypothetical protein